MGFLTTLGTGVALIGAGVSMAGGVIFIRFLIDRLEPYKMEDFDYNFKAMLQEADYIQKDASFVKAKRLADKKRTARKIENLKTRFITDCFDEFAEERPTIKKIDVYGDREARSRRIDNGAFAIHFDELDETIKMLQEHKLHGIFETRDEMNSKNLYIDFGIEGRIIVTYID